MKKTFLAVAFCFLSWMGVMAAPEWPINNNNVMAVKPAELKRDIIKDSDLEKFLKSGNWGQSGKINKDKDTYWNVWSDRSQNATYNGPSESSGQYKELSFNQALRIAKIEKGYALVYTEPNHGMQFPIISEQAVCMGWVKMDHLLLWENCPTNDLGIYHKALIVANVEGWQKAGNKGYDMSFKNPETKEGPKKVKAEMKFYFVMKEDGEYVLLSESAKMSKGTTDRLLIAWVNKNTYIPWEQRTCIEGNWEPVVAENLKGKKVEVYKNNAVGTSIELGRENGATTNPATKYRFPRKRLRFPLFGTSGTQYDITAFTTTDKKDGEFQEDPEAAIDASTQESDIKDGLMKEANKINLVVVIDGTSSMENYYKPMQDAIRKAYETFGKKNGVTVKAGVVIYRDYADGEYLTETLPLTNPESEELRLFLTNGGKYGIKSSPKDRTSAEALYQGLNAALDAKKMGYSHQTSNLMFVVGDCGNDVNDTKIKQQDIIEKCAALNINLVSFQVRNKDNAAFNDFRHQMSAIIRGSLKKRYNDKIKWTSLPDGIVLKRIENVRTPVMAAMRNADKGEEMSPQKLSDIVRENYIKFENVVEDKKDLIYHAEDVIDFDQLEDANEMAEKNVELEFLEGLLTKEQISIIKKRGLLVAFRGNTAQKAQNGQDYWKPVLFITDAELASLLETLKGVKDGAKTGSRKAYVDAMKKLIQAILPDITDEEMNQKEISEIMRLVEGLNVKSQSLSDYKIREVLDEKIVPQTKFDAMVSRFIDKYDALSQIYKNDYEFSVVVQGVRWYWLPIDQLP